MLVFDYVPGVFNTVDYSPEGELLTDENGDLKIVNKKVYDGKVVLRVPMQKERLQYSLDVSLNIKDGVVEESKPLEQTLKMHEIALKHIVSMELKRLDNGYEIKDAETLQYDKDCGLILSDIASKVVRGVALGNGSRSQ